MRKFKAYMSIASKHSESCSKTSSVTSMLPRTSSSCIYRRLHGNIIWGNVVRDIFRQEESIALAEDGTGHWDWQSFAMEEIQGQEKMQIFIKATQHLNISAMPTSDILSSRINLREIIVHEQLWATMCR
jgi:hypothetical protein